MDQIQTSPPGALQRAIQAELKGDDNLALEILAQVQPSEPDFVEARLKRAWLLYQADQNDEAKPLLPPELEAKLLKSLPSATRSKVVGMSKLLDDDDNALNDFQAASSVDLKDLETLVWIANIATNSGKPDLAMSAMDQCMQLDRLNPICGFERIDALAHMGHLDGAIDEYNLLRKNSNYPWLEVPAGFAELANGNFERACEHFNKLISSQGSEIHHLTAVDGLVAVDLVRGKLKSARAKLVTAKSTAGSNYEKADYTILMATIDALHKQAPRAHDELEGLKDPTKSHESSEMEIRIARVYAMIDDFAAAQDVLDRLHGEKADHGLEYGAARSFVAGMESRSRQDYSNAAEQLGNSLSMYKNAETAFFEADAAMRTGDWDSASSALQWIVDNKVTVLTDSVGSLIPLAEYNLGICRKHQNRSDANQDLEAARSMWAEADPDIKDQLSEPFAR